MGGIGAPEKFIVKGKRLDGRKLDELRKMSKLAEPKVTISGFICLNYNLKPKTKKEPQRALSQIVYLISFSLNGSKKLWSQYFSTNSLASS